MSDLTYRYCANILVEAKTPLKVGTGEKGVTVDELAVTDANGLPMIPGTSICGVLRHDFEEKEAESLFGFQNKNTGEGSRLIFSDARFVGVEGKIIDGLKAVDFSNEFYSKFTKMALRDHCKINHRGVADKKHNGKFDSQVVYKGCRFIFDIEFLGNENDFDSWKALLEKLNSPLFRIGGGTRKGFGELEIKAVDEKICNLNKPEDLKWYLEKSSKLTIPQTSFNSEKDADKEKTVKYHLNLQPDDFFMFSSGYGDNEVDAVAKKEIVVEWDNGKPKFSEEKMLIPATSVKGAISHRTAFYYNKSIGNYADGLSKEELEELVGENNVAVAALFGFAKDSDKSEKHGARGKVLFSDLYIDKNKASEKIFNHVAIDRFTGGAIDGALFDEKVAHTTEKIELNIVVENSAFPKDDTKIKEAFEAALKDITTGMLPLGGSTMRGHGCFNGKLLKDEKEI